MSSIRSPTDLKTPDEIADALTDPDSTLEVTSEYLEDQGYNLEDTDDMSGEEIWRRKDHKLYRDPILNELNGYEDWRGVYRFEN